MQGFKALALQFDPWHCGSSQSTHPPSTSRWSQTAPKSLNKKNKRTHYYVKELYDLKDKTHCIKKSPQNITRIILKLFLTQALFCVAGDFSLYSGKEQILTPLPSPIYLS